MSFERSVLLLAALAVLGWQSPAAGQSQSAPRTPLAIKVVDETAGRVFLAPGSAAGLAVGDEVQIGGERFVVAAVSSSFAVVSTDRSPPPLGARGTALVRRAGEQVELGLAPPTPLSRFRGEWSAPARPAESQRPRAVPLGTSRQSRRPNQLVLTEAATLVTPTGDERTFFANELRARLHYQPYLETPLALDFDGALATFGGAGFEKRPGAGARPLLRVRQASLSYGTDSSFGAALGRLRAATSMVGQLDGLRLEAPLGAGLRLQAFGGAAPHSVNGALSGRVTRFGAELAYSEPASSLRPRLVAGAYASRFERSLDERRAYASFDLLPAHAHLGGQAQISVFDANNPWQARSLELSLAGLSGGFEVGPFHVDGQASLRRPERSRWLATLLPREWLCWSAPERASAPCRGGDASYGWSFDGGAHAGSFSVDLGGHSAFTTGTDASSFGGFAQLRWLDLFANLRLDLGMSVISGSVLRTAAAMLAPGWRMAGGRADVSLRYQPALVRYRATLSSRLEHAVGAAIWLSPSDACDVDVSGDWVRTQDFSAFLLQGILIFRIGL